MQGFPLFLSTVSCKHLSSGYLLCQYTAGQKSPRLQVSVFKSVEICSTLEMVVSSRLFLGACFETTLASVQHLSTRPSNSDRNTSGCMFGMLVKCLNYVFLYWKSITLVVSSHDAQNIVGRLGGLITCVWGDFGPSRQFFVSEMKRISLTLSFWNSWTT